MAKKTLLEVKRASKVENKLFSKTGIRGHLDSFGSNPRAGQARGGPTTRGPNVLRSEGKGRAKVLTSGKPC